MLRLGLFNVWLYPDDGAGNAGPAGDNAPGGNAADGTDGQNAGGTQNAGENDPGNQGSTDDLKAEIARLNAEMARQKAALDKATHEASENKKAMNKAQSDLKAKMTAEEIAAQEKKEADEKAAQELEALRREVAKGKTVKSVMGKLGTDEDTSSELADLLYGAADIENALLVIQKAWTARENALKKEYGKLTPPGAGGAGDDSPEMRGVRMAKEMAKARSDADAQSSKALSAYIR